MASYGAICATANVEEAVMAVSPSVQEFLRRSDVEYTVFPHARAYTAKAEAAVSAVPERNWAKAVVCFADDEPVQAVVPADCDVDFGCLARLIDAKHIRMANEVELTWMYPDCEAGAMPPLGPLYRHLVFVDERLAKDEQIAFAGGSHANAIQMRYADFAAITHPVVGRFARSR
jgi:Ala-tRNA(Pro) deacylase